MVRFRRTVKGILAVRLALRCQPHNIVPANAAHQAHGKCHLKLKNEKKTLGRTRGRRGIDLSWQMSLPQKLFVYLGNMFAV